MLANVLVDAISITWTGKTENTTDHLLTLYLQLAYPEGFQPIQVDTNANIALQPILFPTDQFPAFQQHEPQSR